MKYYSEKLRKVFNTADECASAEKEYDDKLAAERIKREELTNTRKARAKEVEEAYKAASKAYDNWLELRNKFIEDYGSWHMTISTRDGTDLFNLANALLHF